LSWFNLIIDASAAEAETIGDLLLELGALSVSVEDRAAGTDAEIPQFAEPGEATPGFWRDNRVVALLPQDSDVDAWLLQLSSRLGQLPPWHTEAVEEQDWVRLTQAQFDPIQVSPRLWITPSWHEPPAAGAINIELDPGLAFGTGAHPTTWMCLAWLDQNLQPGQTVLDYGCGSGILAIAAAKLGAGKVDGVDIDEQAIRASRDNAAANRVQVDFFLPDHAPAGQYDVVLANILANPLRLLAPLLAERCRPGGHVVLAGLLDEQAEELIQIYSPWFSMQKDQVKEGWARLYGVRHQG
jgi:ribosomal protein L11 methyltransferase